MPIIHFYQVKCFPLFMYRDGKAQSLLSALNEPLKSVRGILTFHTM